MNWFLLIAGDTYYPEAYTGDWIGCFPTFDEARAQVTDVVHTQIITKGANKGQAQVTHTSYSIKGAKYDWFEIVDLREWVGGKHD